jgi:hypothetical protein
MTGSMLFSYCHAAVEVVSIILVKQESSSIFLSFCFWQMLLDSLMLVSVASL